MARPDYVERFLDEIIEVCKSRGLVFMAGTDSAPYIALLNDERLTRLRHAACAPDVPEKRCEHYDESERVAYCWRPAAKLVDGSPRCTLHIPIIKNLP